jgi:nicotinate dehydrogenase subunit A
VIELKVNGRSHNVSAEPDTPLLYVLRDDLQLNAAKFGCGLGQCGSCTVLVDGAPTLSCVTPIMLLEGRQITTVEGLGTLEDPGPMQRAFIEEQSAQCGYCIPGMMMRAQALLQRNPRASDAEIRAYLEPNLCRCGTHMRILRAVKRAASLMADPALPPSTQTPAAASTQIDVPDTDSDTQRDRRHSERRERPER